MLHFVTQAKVFWPNATYVLFEAIPQIETLYTDGGYKFYHIGVLSSKNYEKVKFYYNITAPGGSSYYRETGCSLSSQIFTDDGYMEVLTTTLDSVVFGNRFPLPDLVKIDVQGSELDVLKGGINTIGYASKMIVEMQHVDYNVGAPKIDDTMSYISSLNWTSDAPRYETN